MVGCFAWLAVTFTGLLYTEFQDKAFTMAQPFAFGEVATMFWLAVMGAKEPRLATAS